MFEISRKPTHSDMVIICRECEAEVEKYAGIQKIDKFIRNIFLPGNLNLRDSKI